MEISKHELLWLQSEGAKMIADLGVKSNDSVIDFGCGQGRYTIPLSQIVGEKGHVYSFERDDEAIAILNARLPVFSKANIVSLHKEDILELSTSISDKTIDSIFVFDVLQYIKDWDLLFTSFSRVLKLKGCIHIYPAAIPHPGSVDMELVNSKLIKFEFIQVNSNKYRMMHNVDMVDDIVFSFCLD